MVSALPIDFSEYANNILKNTIGEEDMIIWTHCDSFVHLFVCSSGPNLTSLHVWFCTLVSFSSELQPYRLCLGLSFSPQGISAPTTPPQERML